MKKLLFALTVGLAAAAGAAPENLARGKRVTFNAPPNYPLCQDADDSRQLTDGRWMDGPKALFWTQRATVGWTLGGLGERAVTVDLGQDEPIAGFSWNFGAGRAGVNWPDLVFVYVSADGKSWRFVGDLLAVHEAEHGALRRDGYDVCRLHSENMSAHGRYVTFLVRSSGYLFVDEVEVYRGTGQNPDETSAASAVSDPFEHYHAYREHRNFFTDAVTLGTAAQGLPLETCAQLLTSLHRLNAQILRAKGYARPFLWTSDRWANLDLLAAPASPRDLEASPEIELMRGETRSTVVNVTNPTDADLETEVRAEGFPAGANVELREVVHTLVKSGARIGGLLAGEGADRIRVKVPSGTTKQVWITSAKPTCAPGDFAGRIVAADCEKELRLRVAAIDFPVRPRLHVGGWDYNEAGGKAYRSPGSLKARMRRMREMFADTPWATRRVLPQGAKFDAEGHLTNAAELAFDVWNDWVDLWGDQARQYCVFLSEGEKFRGEPMGTPRFNRMVGEYMRAWYDGIRARLNGRRVLLLILDEPRKPEHDAITVAWAKAIKSAVPEFVIFDDISYADPKQASDALIAASDVLCPASPTVTAQRTEDFYRQKAKEGKELWLYSCCGPSRTFDPVAYYRSQAWLAWKLGAKATHFWAFGCGGGIGDSLRPFAQTGVEYSPFFVTQTDAFRAKQSEAVMESVEDYEYLALLADRIAALKRAGRETAALERLLATAPDRVLSAEPASRRAEYSYGSSAARYSWNLPNDHRTVDAVRLEILHALLANPGR